MFPEFIVILFKVVSTLMGITLSIATLLGSLADNAFRERFVKVISGSEDLEETSSSATEKLFDNIFQNKSGGVSIGKILLFYATVSACSFILFRALDPHGFSINVESGVSIYWLMLTTLGFIWFIISYLTSRLSLFVIAIVPAIVRPVIAIGDILLTHIVIVVVSWLATQTNTGYEEIFQVSGPSILNVFRSITLDIFSIERLYDQFALSQYAAAYAVSIVLWIQIIVGAIMRKVFGSKDTSIKSPPLYAQLIQRVAKYVFAGWADAKRAPFAATAIVLSALYWAAFLIIASGYYITVFLMQLASNAPV